MNEKLENTKKKLEESSNNGVESYTQKELLIYLVSKIDRIESNLSCSVKKNTISIARLETTNKYFFRALGIVWGGILFILSTLYVI
jgi:hypothetical protein